MKNLVFIISFLFIIKSLSAQNFREEGYFYGGIKTGGNFSKVLLEKLKYNFGFQIGGLIGYHLTDELGIELETLASFRNAKSTKKSEDKEISRVIKNVYLDFPILAKYYPLNHCYITMGPQFGFNISSDLEEKKANQINIFNFSAIIGLGYNLTENLFFDARYVHSLNNLIKNVPSNFSMFQIGIGFLFSESKRNLPAKELDSFLYK